MKYSGLFIWLIGFGCREYYEPPVLKNNPRLLVVDGFLNSSPDSTYIKLIVYTESQRYGTVGSRIKCNTAGGGRPEYTDTTL